MMVNRKLEGQFKIFRGLIIAVFVLLGLRLLSLQLFEASVYRTKAELNQFRFLPIRAPRGDIVDRRGNVLAASKIVNTISLVRQQTDTDELQKTINKLAALLHDFYPEVDASYINKLLMDHQGRSYEPVVIKRDVPMNVVTRLEERRDELPGVVIGKEIVRFYPNGNLASHVLGYVGEINQEELEKHREDNYRLGDLIGRFGLEAQYEKYLRGQDGFQQVEVDVRGRPIPHKDLVTIPPKKGNRLVLTLDYDLQKTLETAMDKTIAELQKKGSPARAGAAVVLDVRTGAVLAMASRPDFDPNKMVPPVAESTVKKYLTPPSGTEPTMLNRAISSRYPPGSTFKPVTGMAALESGHISLTEKVICKGAYWISPYTKCWGVHGPVDFFRGMAVSCNVFFIEAGRRAGAAMIAKVAHEFGLDQKTGIDLPGEITGVLSSPAKKKAENAPKWEKWYEEEKLKLEQKYSRMLDEAQSQDEKERILSLKKQDEWQLRDLYRVNYNFYVNWHPYETFNMSIGQGENEFTPIELATYVAALANGGKVMRPYLVQRIEDRNGKVLERFGPHVVHEVKVSDKTMRLVREAMGRVTEPGGTGYWLFRDFPVRVAAKTGTAESGRGKDLYHGVFVAFAPVEKPEIAFAGIIEYGYHGSESSGPVARDVFAEYFGLNRHKDGQQEVREEGAEYQQPAAVSPVRSRTAIQRSSQGSAYESVPAHPSGGEQPKADTTSDNSQAPANTYPSNGTSGESSGTAPSENNGNASVDGEGLSGNSSVP